MNCLQKSDPGALLALRAPLRVLPDHIHVWAFMLDASPECIDACRRLLSQEEQARADRFVFARDRDRHLVAHGVMRQLLGLYSGTPPDTLTFVTEGAANKPRLASDAVARSLSFNLTHSYNRALLAVSDGRPIGVDLEQLRTDLEALSISHNYFFGAEREAIAQAPPSEIHQTFFRYWVAKEAVLKAQGIGLGYPLDRFRVDFLPGNQTARIETLDPQALHPDWTVKMLDCDPDWFAAVSAAATDWTVWPERPG